MNSVRAEMALAIRIVNLAYGKLAPAEQGAVDIVADDALEGALRADDRDHALAEILDWRDRQLRAIGEAGR